MNTPVLGADGVTTDMVRDNVRGAEILESAINYELREMAFKQQAKLAILDALFCYGVLKVGYDSSPAYDPGAAMRESIRAQTEGDEPRAGLECDELIRRESVWAKRVSPWDFRWDPDIKQLDPWLSEARWVAFRSVRPLEDVKRDPIYKHTRGLEATAESRSDADSSSPSDGGSDLNAGRSSARIPGDRSAAMDTEARDSVKEGYVVLWEIWCKKDRKLYVMAEGHDRWLREDDWPFDMEGPPFAFLHFHDVPDNRFPYPDMAPWFDHNEAVNLLLSMDLDAARRRMDKLLYPPGAVTSQQLSKMQQPLNSQFCEVAQPDAIKPFKSQGPGMDTVPLASRLMYDIYQMSGIGENQRGGESSNPDKTATEARIVEGNVAARLAEEQDRVSDWAQVAIRKLIQLMQQLYTRQRLAPIVGREPMEWIPYTKDQIQGEYDVLIELSPYNPQRTEMAVKQIMDVLALLSQLAPGGMLMSAGTAVPVNMAKLVEDLLRLMSPNVKADEILMRGTQMPMPGMGAPPMGMQQQPEGGNPGMGPPGGVPLPGTGSGADKRSMFASQGAGGAMVQAARERGNPLPGVLSPSRGF